MTIRQGHQIPLHWILASCARAAVTHMMLWCPIFIVLAVPVALLRRKQASTPEPVLAAIAMLIIGGVVFIADLRLARFTPTLSFAAGGAMAVFAGITAYVSLRWLQNRCPARSFAHLKNATLLASGIGAVASIFLLVRSPLYDPATYRLPYPEVPTSPARGSDKPNLLWIVLDTVRSDHMSCYGYERDTTPFLKNWATTANVFTRTFSNGIWTAPGHAAMFTGKATREHGMDHGNYYLRDDNVTVADVLLSHGYNTASFSANPWISRERNLAKGFEVASIIHNIRQISRFSLESLCKKWGCSPPVSWLDPDFGAALASKMAADWLEDKATSNAPFFLFVNYMEAHVPYRVPRAFREQFLDSDEVRRSYKLRHIVLGNLVGEVGNQHKAIKEGAELESDREILKDQYNATLRYLDSRVEDLLTHMERYGLLENTLIVIASDHGEHLDTHGMWAHRFLTYNDLAHVALIIKTPGQSQGTQTDTPVQLSDIHNTVLTHILGTTEHTGGRYAGNLLEIAANPPDDRFAVTEYVGPSYTAEELIEKQNDPEVTHWLYPQTAIQNTRYKYMISADGTRELYDIQSDPGELNNLIDTHPDIAAPLVSHLRQWHDSMPAYTRPVAATDTDNISESTLQSLRSLGYLGGSDNGSDKQSGPNSKKQD